MSQIKRADAPASLRRIAVAAPVLDGNERAYVNECLDTGWISSNGRFIHDFEAAFATFCGVKHAVATNNGTTALHLALVAAGISDGDEVIVPTLTYVATANAVRYCNATPVFVDCDLDTFNIDVDAIERRITSRTKAIIPVHLYGHPVDMDPIMALAERHGLAVIEDAAEAVGARYKGRMVGSLGHSATFSFFGNKIITTGEGGIITTDDDALAERLRLFRGQGMDPARRYWFPVVGYNYRMTNIQAALGLAQMERIEQHLQRRLVIAEVYDRRFSSLADRLQLPVVKDWAHHVFWMYVVVLGDTVTKSRDQVMQELDALGIETRPVFPPMHFLPPYRLDETHAKAERISARGINLPTHGGMSPEDVEYVADALERVILS